MAVVKGRLVREIAAENRSRLERTGGIPDRMTVGKALAGDVKAVKGLVKRALGGTARAGNLSESVGSRTAAAMKKRKREYLEYDKE